MINIPEKITKRRNGHHLKAYHYELVKIYKHHVLYRCTENGVYESFSKNDFVRR